jgi:hypothetical protein
VCLFGVDRDTDIGGRFTCAPPASTLGLTVQPVHIQEAAVLHGNIHRHLLILSLINWAIAIACWTVSAALGIARPTSLITYTVLFVVGIFAVVVAVACYVLARYGTEPAPVAAPAVAPPAGAMGAAAD